MIKSCTGVILAGGQNSRMLRQNKAFMSVGNERIIDRLLRIYKELFDEVIVVTNSPQEYLDLDVKIITDIYKKECALAGLHAGLFHASNPWIFVAPCDMPFLSAKMIHAVTGCIKPNYTVVIPKTKNGLEALCAAYSKKNLAKIEKNLLTDKYKIQLFFKEKLTRKISEKILREADPDLKSFFNVNTPEDFSFAKNFKHQE